MNERLHIGILYPLTSAEDDYPHMAAALMPTVDVTVVHTEAEDVHTVEECRRTGDPQRLLEGARTLRTAQVDVCLWACTSGSFVYGVAGANQQVQELSDYLGVPVSSTSLAFIHAARALGLTRVAVAAPYPPDLANSFRAFLAEDGVEVVNLGCMGVWSGAEVGQVGREDVLRFAQANDHPDAEAVLIPDTALHTVRFLPELERRVGKAVLTANQVTLWEGLRLAGRITAQEDLGCLLATVSSAASNHSD